MNSNSNTSMKPIASLTIKQIITSKLINTVSVQIDNKIVKRCCIIGTIFEKPLDAYPMRLLVNDYSASINVMSYDPYQIESVQNQKIKLC